MGLLTALFVLYNTLSIHKQKETKRPSIILVEFDDENAGTQTRKNFKDRKFYHQHIDENWTPIFDIERSFTFNKKTFQRIQFPLQPSAGRSVHRAQGSTLEKVVIDLSQRKTREKFLIFIMLP